MSQDDDIILRPDTLACLQEFLAEKAERERQESALINCGSNDKTEEVCFNAFEEDWVRPVIHIKKNSLTARSFLSAIKSILVQQQNETNFVKCLPEAYKCR